MTHGINFDSGYCIGTLESHTYKIAKCCWYAEFFSLQMQQNIKLNKKNILDNTKISLFMQK